ncbi:MAG: hypothetical protein ACLTYN_15060 [Dysosmobacter welbionis]
MLIPCPRPEIFPEHGEALPGMPVTGSLRAVEHFYRAHKDAGYFRLPNAG